MKEIKFNIPAPDYPGGVIPEGVLTPEEIDLAVLTLNKALELGASQCRITASKSLMDLVATLNGEVDKVTHSMDRAMSIALFVDGKFGSFSTNRFLSSEMESFLKKAIDSVRMLAVDPCRTLPSPERTIKDASSSMSLGICDIEGNLSMTPEKRIETALGASGFARWASSPREGVTVLSEEGEFSRSIADILLIDSQGTVGRQTDTAFDYGTEVTLQVGEGKVSSYSWRSNPILSKFLESDIASCADEAFAKALEKAGAVAIPSGKYTMVVDKDCSSRLLSPVVNALSGSAVQQKNSFLMDALGKKVFSDKVTVSDCPRMQGQGGSRLFDSEGVVTRNETVIGNGTVKRYSVSTYIANKTGMVPSVDDVTRMVLTPVKIEERPSTYIRVTGFNGGNCSPVTGDFSYGIEGFFIDGEKSVPVHGMLITGNMFTLWNNLLGAEDDSPEKALHKVGTLTFAGVDFSGE